MLRGYNQSLVNEKYKFNEKEQDVETEFFYYGARYYDGALGIWHQTDPLSFLHPNMSPYNYCMNNPLRFRDLWGLDTVYYGSLQEVEITPTWEKTSWFDAGRHYITNVAYAQDCDEYEYKYEEGEWYKRQNEASPEVIKGIAPGAFTRGSKAINLPSWSKLTLKLEHILSGHTIGGARTLLTNTKSLFPSSMSPKAIEQAIMNAYNTAEKVSTSGERITLIGYDKVSNLTIKMILNKTTQTIETAFPWIGQ